MNTEGFLFRDPKYHRMSHLGQGLHEEGAYWHLRAIVQQSGTGFTHYI